MSAIDRAWAAGFFDGEGCFSASPGTPVATIAQVHLEPLDIFANTVQAGTIKGPYEKATSKIKRRPQWIFYSYGRDARGLLDVIHPWLGGYRAEQAKRAFGDLGGVRVRSFDSWPLSEKIAWCGGIFEGEGCFSRSSAGLTARVANTDVELLWRFAETIGTGHLYGPYDRGPGRKPMSVLTTSGFEEMQAILAMLWPWLSSRRRLTAMGLLDHYLMFYACGHEREDAPWHKYCPQCFRPGPKPGFKRASNG